MHRVAILAPPRPVPFDLAVACDVFGRACSTDGSPVYDVRVCAEVNELDAGAYRVSVPNGLEILEWAETVILTGPEDIEVPVSDLVIAALRAAAARGARIASICSGAFVLAATGLLAGRRATTHWKAAGLLAVTYPDIRVDSDVLYVDEGAFLTSAGAAAAFDLCLHMIRRDHGAAVAADAARLSVMPLERDGGQAQFILDPEPGDDRRLDPLLRWVEQNLSEPLTLGVLSRRAGLSVRSLTRRFREQVGTSPLQWLLRARVRRAQYVLETSDLPVEHVADLVGFGSATAFREQFRRVVGVPPAAWRRRFHSGFPGRVGVATPSSESE